MATKNIQDILAEIKKLNHHFEIVSHIQSGKEADVYRVLLDEKLVAMKLYKNPKERSFKNTGAYLVGKNYRRPSERKAVAKGNKFAKKFKHDNWIKREFFMLKKLYDLGAQIPEPIVQIKNAIFMEFLGDQKNVAFRLRDVTLNKKDAQVVLNETIENMIIFWNFGIIHADLSEYNILWWCGHSYVIDFPQAIDKRNHPNALEILERDLKNITKYFSKFIDIDYTDLRKRFL